MKTISRYEIETNVKREFQSACEWCDGDFGRTYAMMIDLDDGEIWSDIFLNIWDRKIYHSDDVVHLSYGEIPFATAAEKEQGYIDNAIQQLQEAGWTITA